MSANAMLYLSVELNFQPGEIPPSVHVKQGTDSMDLLLKIATDDVMSMETGGTAILKADKPDGSSIFLLPPITDMTADTITLEMDSTQLSQMTDVAGKYKCLVSIIDSENVISEADYEDYDFVTVQPFFMDVEKSTAS